MISVIQCGNCKSLLRLWEKVKHVDFIDGFRDVYRCTNRPENTGEVCGHYTAVSVRTVKDLSILLPSPTAPRPLK